jgi:hypothetical protein
LLRVASGVRAANFAHARFNPDTIRSVELRPCVLCAFQLLGDILTEKSNAGVMMRYVSSKENLMILMNLLRVRCCFGI